MFKLKETLDILSVPPSPGYTSESLGESLEFFYFKRSGEQIWYVYFYFSNFSSVYYALVLVICMFVIVQ